ncbi:MAG: hypothetical protein HKO90_06330 [Flavobacteriaceae bacterium]|nr:hypothetical protein [Flavobacteriaceae bacterium]
MTQASRFIYVMLNLLVLSYDSVIQDLIQAYKILHFASLIQNDNAGFMPITNNPPCSAAPRGQAANY